MQGTDKALGSCKAESWKWDPSINSELTNQETKAFNESKEVKRELVYFSLSPKKGKNSPLRMKNQSPTQKQVWILNLFFNTLRKSKPRKKCKEILGRETFGTPGWNKYKTSLEWHTQLGCQRLPPSKISWTSTHKSKLQNTEIICWFC